MALTLRGGLGGAPTRTTGGLGSQALHGGHECLSLLSHGLQGHRLPICTPGQIRHSTRKIAGYPVRLNHREGGLRATYRKGTSKARHRRRSWSEHPEKSICISWQWIVRQNLFMHRF